LVSHPEDLFRGKNALNALIFLIKLNTSSSILRDNPSSSLGVIKIKQSSDMAMKADQEGLLNYL